MTTMRQSVHLRHIADIWLKTMGLTFELLWRLRAFSMRKRVGKGKTLQPSNSHCMALEIVDCSGIADSSEKYTITGVLFYLNNALTNGHQRGQNTIFACFLGSENVS